MNTGGRTARRVNEPGGSGAGTPVDVPGTGAPRRTRKKPKASPLPSPQPSPAPRSTGPVPRPYLALAPSPVSTLSPSAIDQLASAAQLVLPSSYLRSSNSPSATFNDAGAGPSRPTTASGNAVGAGNGGRRSRYAAGLLSPPTIVPGGSSSTPRIQGQQVPANPRRRSADRDRPGQLSVRRSEERLRNLHQANPSMSSLGQLGQIFESGRLPDMPEEERPVTSQQRRRRRIVRNEAGGLTRRPTVSSREEGRALGLARGASMRRTNVWDDIPEAGEPPPPFPFPTTSTSRLPPAFSTPPDERTESNATPRASSPVTAPPPRPRSPPPTFEQAIGQSPSLHTIHRNPMTTSSAPSVPQVTSRPTLSLSTTLPVQPSDRADIPTPTSASTTSPTSSHFVSAPTSPARTVVTLDDEDLTEEERSDRRMWNSDLLAGYSLEERVRREMARKKARDQVGLGRPSKDEPAPRGSMSEGEALPVPANGGSEAFGDQGEAVQPIQSPATEAPESLSDEPSRTSTTKVVNPELGAEVSSLVPGDTAPPAEDAHLTLSNAPTVILTPPMPSTHIAVEDDGEESRTPGAEIAPDPLEVQQRSASPQSSITPVSSTADEQPLSRTASVPFSGEDRLPIVRASNPTSDPPNSILSDPSSPKSLAHDSPSPASPLSSSPQGLPASSEDRLNTSPVALVKGSASSITVEPSHVDVQPTSPTKQTRKLTRGKAIRRLSASGSPKTSSISPLLSLKRNSEPNLDPVPARPLFKGGAWGYPPETDAIARMDGFPGRAVGKSDEILEQRDTTKVVSPSIVTESLPPNREAALKRRDLRTTAAQAPAAIPKPIKSNRPVFNSSLSSGPLIDLNEDEIISTPASQYMSLAHLAASSADLLELLEIAEEPIAESSAQAAARLGASFPTVDTSQAGAGPRLDLIQPETSSASEPVVTVEDSVPALATAEPAGLNKRQPPPPPPPLRTKVMKEQVESEKTPKAVPSPSEGSRRPPVPTRRPPPPPPLSQAERQTMAPPLPPRPPPPSFTSRPPHIRSDSVSSRTSSSNDTIVPLSEIKSPRLSLGLGLGLGLRPRGPRPPPPPPPRPRKSWAKIVTSDLDDSSLTLSPLSAGVTGIRPMAERTQSDFPRRHEGSDDEDDDGLGLGVASALGVTSMGNGGEEGRGLNRSASEVDMRRRGRGASGGEREYTDLDLLVSRLEGSGREFEGFTQITTFLGPSKAPAASPEAIATLLPGLINVDSRRTTPQGKVKLKLSLLGVRVSKCPICLSQFRGGEKGIMLPSCGHSGHESCVMRWFREDGRCFVCREVLGAEE
ncbi:hypothetical protein IAR55_004313 [Kwoniella newhampshirensis]|uniref:RING-type domain-containing protein n=1 Tax=Kwoniella newhampshirensis TaxID=1651941 RepID=A0AAW0YV46_9TREE